MKYTSYGHPVPEFAVNGRHTDADSMMMTIPREYANMFDGFSFKDVYQLSRAIMYASCAKEARVYGRHDRQLNNEHALKTLMGVI